MPDFNDPASVWEAVLGRLQLEMPREHYNAFLRPCVGYEWKDGDLMVAAASSFVITWLELPLHLAMAEEALAKTLSRNSRIVYRAMPGVAGVPIDDEKVVATTKPAQPEDPDQCPNHPEALLRRRTKFPALLRAAERTGDEIYYCVGDSGHCTWVYSRQAGVFIRPGMEYQTPVNILRAYQQTRRDKRPAAIGAR